MLCGVSQQCVGGSRFYTGMGHGCGKLKQIIHLSHSGQTVL
jgi:hypothetical protein